jgi:hypothetical protein
MKTNLLFCAVVVSLLWVLGCKKEDPEKEGPCGVKDPAAELPWLKKVIERYQNLPGYTTNYSAAIGTTIHKKERVFWIYDFLSSDGSAVFRCDGSSFTIPPMNIADEEEKATRKLMAIPTNMCPYLVWATPAFKESNKCN